MHDNIPPHPYHEYDNVIMPAGPIGDMDQGAGDDGRSGGQLGLEGQEDDKMEGGRLSPKSKVKKIRVKKVFILWETC